MWTATSLATHPFGPGTVAVRVDQFNTRARPEDVIRTDVNSEFGRALALAYHWRISPSLSLVSEVLVVASDRPARRALGLPTNRLERSLTAALRLGF